MWLKVINRPGLNSKNTLSFETLCILPDGVRQVVRHQEKCLRLDSDHVDLGKKSVENPKSQGAFSEGNIAETNEQTGLERLFLVF